MPRIRSGLPEYRGAVIARVLVPALLVAATAGAAGDPFRPLKLPSAASLAKEVEPQLPQGIVTEAAPFDALVRKLLEPYQKEFAERREAIRGLDAAKLKAAFGVMAKENADFGKRLARVEADYAEVYNRGWMEASEKERDTRKMAAVLIPFYRTLLLSNRAVAIVYSESYRSWEDGLVPANARGKKKAHAFVDGIVGNGTTNISDSLDRLLESGADTIFLLSDGDPNRGRVSSLDALLTEFLGRNRMLRVVIHTIGIGEVEGSAFLKELARRTGGRYVGFR